jgi:hypothetical protein
MGNQVGRRELGLALVQCAASCERALKEYSSGVGVPIEHALFRAVIPAIATLRTAAHLLHEESKRELALQLAHRACSDAAIECRRYGLDQPLLRCAAACDLAVAEIELLLTSLVHD